MTEILGQFPDDELPPSRVDIARAVRSGKRARRIRTALAAGGVVLGLAVAAGTAPIWLASLRGGPPPAGGACATPEPPPTAPSDWAHLDLLRHEIDVSGVAGYHLVRYQTARYFQVADLSNAAGDRVVTVTLYASGGVPHDFSEEGALVPFDPATGDPVRVPRWLDETTHGEADAYWRRPVWPGSGELLSWQWAPGAWLLVNAFGDPNDPNPEGPDVDPAELRAIAQQVAADLRVGVGVPLAAPFTMPVPVCTRLTGTLLSYSPVRPAPWGVRLHFATDADPDPISPMTEPARRGAYIDIEVWAPPSITGIEPDPGVPIDDLPAEPLPEGLLQADKDGFDLSIYVAPIVTFDPDRRVTTRDPRLPTPETVYDSMQFYPDAAASTAGWGPPISP